jgi:signal transduction histidine kinase
MIAIGRFNMIEFASELRDISFSLLDRFRDPYTSGRIGTIYPLFVGFAFNHLHTSITQLDSALEYTIVAGDRILTTLNLGIMAVCKFYASEHLDEVESYCRYSAEEVVNWESDVRGGVVLAAVRQCARALAGKTQTDSAIHVLSDIREGEFNSQQYLNQVRTRTANMKRPIQFYECIEIIPLYLFGHYERAVEAGSIVLEGIADMWSGYMTRSCLFWLGLSRVALLSDNPTDEELSQTVEALKLYRKMIEDWQTVTDVNFLHWSKLLSAQIDELTRNFRDALQAYETALDHAQSFGFILEEALGSELMANYFLRRGARRAAKAALRDAIALYKQVGAAGKARHLVELHKFLLEGPSNTKTIDAAVQTDFSGDSPGIKYCPIRGDEEHEEHHNRASVSETKGERIDAWQGGSASNAAPSGVPTLDMLDLTSILESSQVISSVLQVDELLKTMAHIILENCGGLADFAAIVVEDDSPNAWSVAASGDPEHGCKAHIPGIPLAESDDVSESIVRYCTRFRGMEAIRDQAAILLTDVRLETVLVPNIILDERFSNVSEAWLKRNPAGKSVIAIPIIHGEKPLLGLLYLEGQPNAFTDRNQSVLQLLVNQIGISYSNALTLKDLKKSSAANESMVLVQKKALAKARDAEAKAKRAEAEAIRNVQIAEEASKARSLFLANVSHELRTPLNGVIGNSELLKNSPLSKEQELHADSIRVSADLLLTVINDILDYSKLEADKMKLFPITFNVDDAVREVVRAITHNNLQKKGLEIVQDLELPRSTVFGDPVRLHQVLMNLIGNSLKFTASGTITVGARTEMDTDDIVRVRFWVEDTGIGISKEQLKKLFQPFSQADSSTARRFGGSGLGLSICKQLIETLMKGEIWLVSDEGKGTTVSFRLTFPKAAKDNTAGQSEASTQKPDPMAAYSSVDTTNLNSRSSFIDLSSIPRDQLRICIAEDNPINQKIAIQFVQRLGFKQVDAYDNGLEAVEALRRESSNGMPYHLVLMDVQMPV